MFSATCGNERDVDESNAVERSIRSSLRAFTVALDRGDYAMICDLVTPAVKADWARFARSSRLSSVSCPDFARGFYGAGKTADLKRELRLVEEGQVHVIGETALVRVSDGENGTFFLERRNGRWLVTTRALYVDEADAAEVAESWADAHRRSGERVLLGACSARGEEPLLVSFVCPVEFQPGDRIDRRRRIMLYLRAEHDYRRLRIVRVSRNRDS